METGHAASFAAAAASAIGAFLAYDTAPVITLILVITGSILGGIITARFVMRGIPREIDKAFAAHLKTFHHDQILSLDAQHKKRPAQR